MTMRVGSIARRVAVAVAMAGAVAAGCSSSKPTELVPGIMTQLQLPRDLQAIRIDLQANGAQVFCRSYQALNGVVTLPSTLGVVSQSSPNTTVTITVGGYDQQGANGQVINDCSAGQKVDPTSPDAPRVVRRSVQTYVAGHTLFIPMPISFSCFDEDCTAMNTAGATYSCKGGSCVKDPDPKEAASKLVDFTPSLIDGTDACFDWKTCFPPSAPTALWTALPTADDCVYTALNVTPAGTGLNVRVFYQEEEWAKSAVTGEYETTVIDGGEEEILDDDPIEGFTLVSPAMGATTPVTFRLADGLCKLAKNASTPPPHPATGTSRFVTITDIQVSELCPSKVQLLPLCATDRYTSPNLPDGSSSSDGICNVAVPLLQTPSAIYLVMDDSEVMHTAFGDKGYATAMSLSLSDPVFQRTSAAFSFLTHNDVECPPTVTTAYKTPTVPFDVAANAQTAIASTLKAWTAPDTGAATPAHLDLLAATQPFIGAYSAVQSYLTMRETPDIAGVMFFVNRVPGGTAANPASNDCSVASVADARTRLESDALSAFSSSPSLQTFFVVFGNDQSDPDVLAFYQQLQTDHPGFITTLDATSSDATVVVGNFAQVVTRLGTCLYELPEGTTAATPLTVQYAVPGTTTVVQVPKDPTCTSATQDTANGWNIDGPRLRICGSATDAACGMLRGAVLAATATAVQNSLPAPDVPVTTTLPCPASSDAGLGGD
jgi:hypothetical protein